MGTCILKIILDLEVQVLVIINQINHKPSHRGTCKHDHSTVNSTARNRTTNKNNYLCSIDINGSLSEDGLKFLYHKFNDAILYWQ